LRMQLVPRRPFVVDHNSPPSVAAPR
jgi:hypothetical protein